MAKTKSGDSGARNVDDQGIRTWLEAQPKKALPPLVGRMALRALPLVAFDSGESDFRKLVSAVFRASAFARIAATYPTLTLQLADAADAAYAAALDAPTTALPAREAARAAAYAAVTYPFTHGTAAIEGAHAALSAVTYYAFPTVARYVVRPRDPEVDPVKAPELPPALVDVATSSSVDSEFIAISDTLALADAPLWPNGATPNWASDMWTRLRVALPAGDDWEVWTDWYDARLLGQIDSEKAELVYDTVPLEKLDEGPAAANRWIKEELEKLKKKKEPIAVPPARAASVEPVIRHDRMVQSPSPGAEIDARSVGASLRALNQELLDLAGELEREVNSDKRAIAYLRDLAGALPLRKPSRETLFAIGHRIAALHGYDKHVSEQWPDFLASRYFATTLGLEETWRKFPKWREFKRTPLDDLSEAQIAATVDASSALVAILTDEQAAQSVDAQIPQALIELVKSIDHPPQMATPEMAEAARKEAAVDARESVNNVLKLAALNSSVTKSKRRAAKPEPTAAEKAKTWGKKKVERALRGFDKGLDTAIDKNTKRIAGGLVTGGATYASDWILTKITGVSAIEKIPQIWEWLKHFLHANSLL